MVPVEEMSEKTNTVELIIRVCLIQLLENLKFLQASLVPVTEQHEME